ncbi:hypothetical protein LWI29_009649 [Acer saccharum]|uniref:Receptor-like PK ALE2 N-terminal domain-containing protein n=1 Tax=Acer saccharum TaxID=4024 RepID=A0AA39S7K1_ACESA|nr:hypothetical protein LWI29_009649 [Acer saccharum]
MIDLKESGDDSLKKNESTILDGFNMHESSSPITLKRLNGTNYVEWSLNAHNKICGRKCWGFISCTKAVPKDNKSEEYKAWEYENCLVKSWLIDAITKDIISLFLQLATAKEIWEVVKQTYSVDQDASKVYQLHYEVCQSQLVGRSEDSLIGVPVHSSRVGVVPVSSEGPSSILDVSAGAVVSISSATSMVGQGSKVNRDSVSPLVSFAQPIVSSVVSVDELDDRVGCDQICVEPLTGAPFGSHCGCVFPMKVGHLLDVAPYGVFPAMHEVEIEVAAETYLQQSQVKIMVTSADSQNQGKTVVDNNLVPLGEKFDNTTAVLTYDRLWHMKVPLNMTLFGNYEVIYINYPGIPSSPPYGGDTGSSPSESVGGLPITANFVNKNQRMNLITIAIIALSAFVLLLVFVGAISILIKWRKSRRPSSAVGPAFTSSTNKRSGPYHCSRNLRNNHIIHNFFRYNFEKASCASWIDSDEPEYEFLASQRTKNLEQYHSCNIRLLTLK